MDKEILGRLDSIEKLLSELVEIARANRQLGASEPKISGSGLAFERTAKAKAKFKESLKGSVAVVQGSEAAMEQSLKAGPAPDYD